ncbi:MAG: amidohydrolase family protein [Saprospiraceae bacterium]|jgi:imidazolonepropionase-like amidohydrolase|nr:amidohydrolase family protein [Saprospiraceae bacterium]MDP4852776.1 amidohydrolase family protein [Saprospiraceae bacterium]MDP4914166.1 amidohydrolase family protein [Saprospiraceae bacterium]MDP5049431.1 amidohydrolase family protein [Saprospiraceae bacterium]MDP5090435.1 amidohydrolase family protein [Saprospiraceae bacterium]
MKNLFKFAFCLILYASCFSPNISLAQDVFYLTADRLFDGEKMWTGKAVLVKGNKIMAIVEKSSPIPSGAKVLDFKNATLLPGLIEGHAHLFLYPYNITDWDTQVLKETDALRTIRASVHAKNTLMAGFTSVRDLGTEGAGYADVSLKKAILDKIIEGPRMLVAGRAIVSTGSYGPKGYDNDQKIMLGAEPADGNELVRVVRDQIWQGADFIKIYADYRWGLMGEDRPTFTLDELKLINEVTTSSGRVMVCHAKSKEAIRRSVLAGAVTIEHGDFLDEEIGKLMKEHQVIFMPTIAAVDKITQYRGWKKGIDPDPENVVRKKLSFKAALASGVTIGMGGDVGVFPHGDNVMEMELMAEYGMPNLDILKAATSVNARAMNWQDKLGHIKEGFLADLVVVKGNPLENISQIREVKFVMKDGVIYK